MVEPTGVKRKLAVILAADAEGYTRLMREAEEPTLETLTEYRDIIDGLIARHDGRIFGTAGDSVVASSAALWRRYVALFPFRKNSGSATLNSVMTASFPH